jgi:membrane fusion protein (multidrug efflux system)
MEFVLRHLLITSLLFFISVIHVQASENPAPAVIVHTVAVTDLTPTYKLVGRLEASERVNLLARVSGFLQERLFTEGRDVETGQALFSIERNLYEIFLKQAQAELASARAALKITQAILNRNLQLRKRQAISQSQFEQTEADRDQAKAQVLKTEAGLQKAKLDLSYTQIRSPFSGRIGKSSYSVGDLVSPESGTLATVVKLDPIYVEMSVSVKLLLAARRDGIDLDYSPVAPTLKLSDGSTYEHTGTFNFISPEVDRNTDTIILRASFPNPDDLLLPGEFVNIEVKPKQTEMGIRIPQSAVQRDHQGYYVMEVTSTDFTGNIQALDSSKEVNKSNSRVTLTRVEMGQQFEGQWRVLKGLEVGDLIITEGLQKVKPGLLVNAVRAVQTGDE